MKGRFAWTAILLYLSSLVANAHVGSPDVFYEGLLGPYPTRITIRMPAVVPGRAEITARVQSSEPITVSFAPISSKTAVSNAPPADVAQAVRGEANLYSGELWLMTTGAYSINVKVHGKSGDGSIQIPVNSVATRQLPLPPYLSKLLTVLGLILFCGGIAIVAAATSESVLPPGTVPGKTERRGRRRAIAITTVVFVLLLIGGKKWWSAEESKFRQRLHDGGWPDLGTEARVEGGQRILRLTLGKIAFGPHEYLALAPDHGKLLHLFLAREPNHEAFAHIHPVRAGDQTFDVVLPPLPEGDYEVLCDLTLEESGVSSTATNSVHLGKIPTAGSAPKSTNAISSDPDDSWAVNDANAVAVKPGVDTICQLPGGLQMIWKAHPAATTNQDASLQFEVRDAAGQPVSLEPYMGMMSHVAVLRSDGRVFAHLHPTGNFSMAAQMFFDAKMENEGGMPSGMDHSMMGMDMSHMHHHMAGTTSVVSLPYEFPTVGDYRLWAQVKSGGQILTGIFDVTVK
jgi:hypothetical protein